MHVLSRRLQSNGRIAFIALHNISFFTLTMHAQMKCHWNTETKLFEAWERGQHSEKEMVPPKRGLAAGVLKKVNAMAKKQMAPSDILEALERDPHIAVNMLPNTSQISSRKRGIKSDTSEDSDYRLVTFNDLTTYLNSKKIEDQECYDALG